MNPVLLLVRDNLEMNKRCIDSICSQDVPTTLVIADNSEQDDTVKWALDQNNIAVYPFRPQIGVSRGWNFGLGALFKDGWEHVLVPNSDTILPPWFYSSLLNYDVPFVTGVSVGNMAEIAAPPPRKELVEHPDMSAFLIRRECWERVGKFDENMVHYCGDLDYHIRAYRSGVHLMNAGVPFYHERSSTLRLSTPKDRRLIELQADADRRTFTEKWGCATSGPSYDAMFTPQLFGAAIRCKNDMLS